MTIHKGSIYWVDFSSGDDSGNDNRRRGLVIQNNALNNSKLNTVSVLAITPLLKFGELPGNVVLEKGEANLPEKCVVNVTQIKAIEKSRIKEMIGSVTEERMSEIHDGLKLVMNIP
jgi:mRNA interferase MazF